MKIGGQIVDGPKTLELYIPRGNDVVICFKFVGVTDDSEFEKIYPEPSPPRSIKPGIGTITNTEDPGYKEQIAKRDIAKRDWFFLKSISPSQIEWDTVKMDDPTSWGNWRNDLKAAGFS